MRAEPRGATESYGARTSAVPANEMAWGIAPPDGSGQCLDLPAIPTFPPTFRHACAISRTFRGGANIATNPSGDAFVAQLNSTGTALLRR